MSLPIEQRLDREWFKAKDLARMVGMNYRTILVYVKNGEIKAGKIGDTFLIHKTEVERLLGREVQK